MFAVGMAASAAAVAAARVARGDDRAHAARPIDPFEDGNKR